MDKSKILFWLPRILAIGYILFLGIFAFDVFETGKSIPEILIGLLIHLIPNFILAVVLIIAWRWPKSGGVIFIFLAGVMWWFFRNPLLVNLMLLGPVVLIGLLFLTDGFLIRKEGEN